MRYIYSLHRKCYQTFCVCGGLWAARALPAELCAKRCASSGRALIHAAESGVDLTAEGAISSRYPTNVIPSGSSGEMFLYRLDCLHLVYA